MAYTVDEVKKGIVQNNSWAIRGLICLYEKQTVEEQDSSDTVEKNGVGFNMIDAPLLTNIAEFYLERGFLSKKQLEIVRKKLLKYSRQLAGIANSTNQQTQSQSQYQEVSHCKGII